MPDGKAKANSGTKKPKPKPKGKGGRPKLDIDPDVVERLAFIHCTNSEIAAVVGCSVDTIADRFSDVIKHGREKGKMSLRRWQFKKAESGNVAMLIWLGKQCLDQRERADVDLNGGITIAWDETLGDL